jgi:hypothetical protein
MMKKILKIMANMLLVAAFATTAVSCSKDDDENPLIGKWVYNRVDFVAYLNGESFSAEDAGIDQSEVFSDFRGIFFVFEENGTLTAGQNGDSAPAGTYTVAGDRITVKDGAVSFTWRYVISGNTLQLIWNRDELENMAGELPDELDIFDDIEFILIFTKA